LRAAHAFVNAGAQRVLQRRGAPPDAIRFRDARIVRLPERQQATRIRP